MYNLDVSALASSNRGGKRGDESGKLRFHVSNETVEVHASFFSGDFSLDVKSKGSSNLNFFLCNKIYYKLYSKYNDENGIQQVIVEHKL